MPFDRSGSRFFEIPHAAVFLIMTANIAIYALCLGGSGSLDVPVDVLFRNGAMYSQAMQRHEYWRLFAHGFLHVNLLHLATNMLCLALWGGLLEKRVGSFYFIVIYAVALVSGGIVSDAMRADQYLSVGASGAVSGILGALLCLWILGKIDLSAGFFVTNIGLNVVLALGVARIDWASHLGGFVAGLIGCAGIDVVERINAHVLRCKFPEFVKVNGLIVAGAIAVLAWNGQPSWPTPAAPAWPPAEVAVFVAACLVAVKLTDVVLSLRHGLAIVVVALAAANAVLIPAAGAVVAAKVGAGCASPRAATILPEPIFAAGCANPWVTIAIAAACTFVLTILLYSQELYRGVKDVGFAGASLRAERQRRRGI
jgi:rhomboid protease GluP